MTIRAAQILIIAAVALLHGLIAFNNITDYGSNFTYISHVMRMDTTFHDNAVMWRAIDSVAAHHAAYVVIIAWQVACTAWCLAGSVGLYKARTAPAAVYGAARARAIAGLTAGLMLWLVAFFTIAGEWFVMWQSTEWNSQEAAFRMLVIVGLALLVVTQPEPTAE